MKCCVYFIWLQNIRTNIGFFFLMNQCTCTGNCIYLGSGFHFLNLESTFPTPPPPHSSSFTFTSISIFFLFPVRAEFSKHFIFFFLFIFFPLINYFFVLSVVRSFIIINGRKILYCFSLPFVCQLFFLPTTYYQCLYSLFIPHFPNIDCDFFIFIFHFYFRYWKQFNFLRLTLNSMFLAYISFSHLTL